MTGIVVGVSARRTSADALTWAAAEAASRGVGLVVVRAWRPLAAQAGSRGTPTAVTADRQAARAAADDALHNEVAAVLGQDHGADVHLIFGGKRRALLEAAAGAELLVIEAPRVLDRGSGPGFVSRLVAKAPCPVVVVPRGDAGAVRRRAAAVGDAVVEAAGRAGRPGISHPRP